VAVYSFKVVDLTADLALQAMAFLKGYSETPSTEEIMAELHRFLSGSQEQSIIKAAKAAAAVQAQQQKNSSRSHHSRNQPYSQQPPVNIPIPSIPLKDVIHSGIFLARHLPVSRDAVFERISETYNDFVQKYVARIEVYIAH